MFKDDKDSERIFLGWLTPVAATVKIGSHFERLIKVSERSTFHGVAVKKKKPYAATQTGLRPLDLVGALNYERPELKFAGQPEKVALGRTTTYRTRPALRSRGLAGREANNQKCRLGPEIIILGGRALHVSVTAMAV